MTVQGEDALDRKLSSHPFSCYPYSPSIASTASSSAASLFSADNHSSQSSAPSSSKSSALAWGSDIDDSASSVSGSSVSSSGEDSRNGSLAPSALSSPLTRQSSASSVVLPGPDSKIHPRRTRNPSNLLPHRFKLPAAQCPSSLVRQSDRKENFVEGLVDIAAKMIEAIWPLSLLPCSQESLCDGKTLIGLKTFIQEVLRRSKTSYSTLQVALYYLVAIKAKIPKVDFTKKQPEDSANFRAMQCGRRMFLAALILASKYLQDRNYSARAWSKISGLKVSEINANELCFLKAVDWRLHIRESRFQKWADVVLKFSHAHSSFDWNSAESVNSWRHIVLQLDHEKDDFNYPTMAMPKKPFRRVESRPSAPPELHTEERFPNAESGSEDSGIAPALACPSKQRSDRLVQPRSPNLGRLQTPQLSPRSSILTPAEDIRREAVSSLAWGQQDARSNRPAVRVASCDRIGNLMGGQRKRDRPCPDFDSILQDNVRQLVASPEDLAAVEVIPDPLIAQPTVPQCHGLFSLALKNQATQSGLTCKLSRGRKRVCYSREYASESGPSANYQTTIMAGVYY